jgi:SAM-dependent methyltransferase
MRAPAGPRGRGRPGGSGLPEVVRSWLPELTGRHVLQLVCGAGEATEELVRRGAFVTAVDTRADLLAAARERVPSAAFLHVDPRSLPAEVRRGRFDLVLGGEGTVSALGELGSGAAGVVATLRPNGYLLLYDVHPVLACVDATLHWTSSYFRSPPGRERVPPLGEVVTAFAQAGLSLRRLEELPAPYGDVHVPGRFALVARRD